MTAEKFWSGWLKVTMIMIIFAGLFLIALYHLGLTGFIDKKIDNTFFSGNDPGEAVHRLRIWMISVAGSVMIGWGMIMLYIVNQPFSRKEKWAWRSIFYSILTWYLIDSSISFSHGVGINIILNTIVFLQVVAPLLFLRNQFFPKLEPAL
jgi:hypothetical protein